MKAAHQREWTAFGFSAFLSGITLVGSLVGEFVAGRSDAAMIPFICFLPVVFYMAGLSQAETRKQIEALEARVKQLERQTEEQTSDLLL